MKATLTLLFAIAAAAPLSAQSGGFVYFPSSKLKGYSSTLKAKADPKTGIGMEQLGNYGNYTSMVARRDRNGEPEVHADWNDIFIVQEGEGTLLYGGKVEGGHDTQPGETRGGKIVGGSTQRLGPGDVAVIPAGMPHQSNVASGKTFTYVVFKVKKQ